MTVFQLVLAFAAGMFFGQGTLASLIGQPFLAVVCLAFLGVTGLGLVVASRTHK